MPMYKREEHLEAGRLKAMLKDVPDDAVVVLHAADSPHPVTATLRSILPYEKQEWPWASQVLELWS